MPLIYDKAYITPKEDLPPEYTTGRYFMPSPIPSPNDGARAFYAAETARNSAYGAPAPPDLAQQNGVDLHSVIQTNQQLRREALARQLEDRSVAQQAAAWERQHKNAEAADKAMTERIKADAAMKRASGFDVYDDDGNVVGTTTSRGSSTRGGKDGALPPGHIRMKDKDQVEKIYKHNPQTGGYDEVPMTSVVDQQKANTPEARRQANEKAKQDREVEMGDVRRRRAEAEERARESEYNKAVIDRALGTSTSAKPKLNMTQAAQQAYWDTVLRKSH